MTEWMVIFPMSRIGYLFAEGFRGIFKHGFMSFASVTIIMACLIIMGSVSLLSVNIDALIGDLEDQNEVVALVDETLSDSEAAALQQSISQIDNINTSQFVSREAAMDNFMGNYDASLMEGIDATVFRHRYVIQLTDIAQMAKTKQDLETNQDGWFEPEKYPFPVVRWLGEYNIEKIKSLKDINEIVVADPDDETDFPGIDELLSTGIKTGLLLPNSPVMKTYPILMHNKRKDRPVFSPYTM